MPLINEVIKMLIKLYLLKERFTEKSKEDGVRKDVVYKAALYVHRSKLFVHSKSYLLVRGRAYLIPQIIQYLIIIKRKKNRRRTL